MTTLTGLEDILPLTPLQEGLLFHGVFDENATDVYLSQVRVDVEGALTAARLRAAVQALLARHPALRTGFRYERLSRPVQIIPREVPVPWQEHDLRSADDPRAEAARLETDDLARRFDLTAPPLMRFTLLRLGERRFRLVLTFHHLLIDGWSVPVVLRELFHLYASGADDRELPPAMPYRDYLSWLGSRDQEAAHTAWSGYLDGLADPTLVAPAGTSRTATAPRTREFTLGQARSDALRTLARSHGVTLATLVQTAWGLVLHSLTGLPDVVFGVTVSGRPPELADVDSAVGFFINTVPARVRLHPGESVSQLLRRVQAELGAVLEHQHLGLAEIQRRSGHGELFDTLVVLRSYPHTVEGADQEQPGDGPRVTGVSGLDAVHYPLGLVAVPGQELRLRLDHRPDVFDDEYADQVVARLHQVLEALVEDPSRLVGRLPLITPAELERAHAAAAGPPAEPVSHPLSELFRAQVARTPHALAVVGPDEGQITFTELDQRSDRLAGLLRDHGVTTETPVALALDRSAGLVIAVLAVVKAGGSYVPLHSGHPQERLQQIVHEVGAALVIADDAWAQRAQTLGKRVLRADQTDQTGQTGQTDSSPAVSPTPDPGQIACVMFTSGSGGVPKGVAVTHRAIATRVSDSTWADAARPRVLLQAPPAFDASTNEIWPALLRGGCLIVPPPGDLTPETLRTLIPSAGLTGVCLPTALFGVIAEEDPAALSGLHQVWIGGETASAAAVRHVLEHCPGTTVTNVYGPTEATTYVTSWHARFTEDVADGLVPAGYPATATQVHLLDHALRPVSAGAVGEVYLAGDGLARGYAGRAGATAERFVADPFGEPGGRMYRTGDLARRDAAGRLLFAGRADRQVKIRGFRVEPAEVEAALTRLPEVTRAVVVADEDPRGGRRLVAYVTGPAGRRDLRAELATVVPDYMVPAVLVPVTEFVLTPNGKVDHQRLPPPETEAATGIGQAPRTPREEILCSLFADVLGLPRVGTDDDFFALGGHSLLATRLVSRIRSVLGVRLAMSRLFETPTVSGLGDALTPERGQRPVLGAGPRPDRLPLSFGQQRLWFLHQLEGPNDTYTTAVALRLRGPLDPEALRLALGDVVERHESLRTVFAEDAHGAHQVVLTPEQARPELPISSTSEEARGFDLARDIPVRAHLQRLAPEHHVLTLSMHHIAGDAWSRGPLTRDLGTAYAARQQGHAPGWTPLPLQYADYALWQRDLLSNEESLSLAFWREHLHDLPDHLDLPTDRPRPAQPSHRGGLASFTVPPHLRTALEGLARDQHATLFMVLQAALATMLTRLGAGTDIPVGTPVAGRAEAALDELVGFFVNTLVLRTDTAGDPTFNELLGRVRKADLAAYEHQDVPFERVVEALNPERSLATHPLFQVLLTHNTAADASAAGLHLPGLTVSGLDVEAEAAKFELAFAFFDRPTALPGAPELRGVVEYSTDLFDQATAQSLADRLLRLLQQVADNPGTRISAVDLLDLTERHDVLERWNNGLPAVRPATFGQLFAPWASRTPQQNAVECNGRSLTYQELDEAGDRLAHQLVARGAGPEKRVAVALTASIEWIVAITAVLKAGAVYVPLDVTYPAERLAHQFADASPVLLVTTTDLEVTAPDDLPTLYLDVPGAPPKPVPLNATRPEAAAYVMYTSGSTGKPKGVEITHTGLAGMLAQQRESWGIGSGSRVLQLVPVGFDASLWDVLGALGNGATLVLTGPDRPLGADLAAFAERHTITHVTAPPAVVADLADHGLAPEVTVTVTGEVCPPALAARLAGERTVVNGYGPTETTIGATFWICRPQTQDQSGPVPIGRPIGNTRVYVLDERLRPVPPGVAGEIYIAGPGLGRGYVNRAGHTAERFVADPHGAAGARMYRTGDVGRRLADGILDFVRRSDDQVKIRGLRIEPAEIEAVLLTHPQVARCIVIARKDLAGTDARLVAYVVPPEGSEADPGSWREHLAARLPRFMMPAAYVRLDELPLTTNGKIDRDALPQPTESVRSGRLPRTPREEVLRDIFAEVLDLPSVSVDDDFFQVGGHSLLVPRLVAAVRSAFGVGLTIRTVFEHPSAAGLATALETTGSDPFDVVVPLRSGGSDAPLFCVHPGLGLSWCYSRLSRHLVPGLAVTGIQARGFTGDQALPADVGELISDYCDQVQKHQPAGPYRLLGWSSGGLIAHRMATLLRARGEQVELLALVDAYPRTGDPDTAADQALALEGLRAELGTPPGTDLENLTSDASEASTTAENAEASETAEQEAVYLERLRRREHPLGQLPQGRFGAAVRTYLNLVRLGNELSLEKFDGDVLLFTSPQAPSPLTWQPYLKGELEVQELPAEHADLLSDPASLALIGQALRRLA